MLQTKGGDPMTGIIIDEVFKYLLPVLDRETHARLEEDLMKNGCMHPLVLWNGILVDGYNRYMICTEHGIPIETIDKEFASREDALIWIISNQVSRRNLTPLQLSYYRGLHYKADIRLLTNPDGKNQYSEVDDQNEHQPQKQSTAQRLSERYRVSPITIRRDSKLSAAIDAIGDVSPEAKRKILHGEIAINKSKLETLLSKPQEDIDAVAAEIESGTYKRRQPAAPVAPETGNPSDPSHADKRQLDAIAKSMTSDFDVALQKLYSGGMQGFKTTLRSYINSLEDLYSSI